MILEVFSNLNHSMIPAMLHIPKAKGLVACWGEGGSQKFVEIVLFCGMVLW